MTYHCMGASVVSVLLCHLGRRGVLYELVSVVRAMGLWLLDLSLYPSEVLQVPDALSWKVVAFSAAEVLMFSP